MAAVRTALILWIALTGSIACAQNGAPGPVETVKDMIGAMTSSTPVRDTVVQRAYLSHDLLRFMGSRTSEQWREFDADPILGTQDWSDWKLGNLVLRGNEVDAVFVAGTIRIERDFVVVKDGEDWRVDNVFYHDGGKVTDLRELLGSKPVRTAAAPHRLDPSPFAAALTARYPWSVKAQGDLTAQECAAAARHDRNFWWSGGRCHMKFIRYAAGVAVRDTHALEDQSSVRRKGELFSPTQYRPDEDAYCEHGGYCYPAKDIKLLGSIRTAPDTSYATGDKDVDVYQGVTTSCEMLEEDRANIVAVGAQDLFRDCR